ncbi:MAG: hypothetical protein VKK04_06405 [Synechococcales bacterium]|nr:hypothetical protein [Synechococcales bacterium]
MNDIELLKKWTSFLLENPAEMQRLCDRIYELLTEEVWRQRERSGDWQHRL